jgi:uroporphyrinogen decarboxylase
VIGIDTAADLGRTADLCGANVVLQGNLDPLALIAGGRALEKAVHAIVAAMRNRPHIFNLGHGILPETPIAHVEQLMRLVRGEA